MILVLFLFFLALILIVLSAFSLIIGVVLLIASHFKKDKVKAKKLSNIGVVLTAVASAILLNIIVLAIYIYSNFG